MNRDKLFPRWQRQFHRLLQRQELLFHLACKNGRPQHIHALRVALRRLRVMLRVCSPLVDSKTVDQYLRWSKKITLATSHLRDFDVTLEWLSTQSDTQPIIQPLSQRRQRLWKMSRTKFIPLPKKIRARIRRLASTKNARKQLNHRYLEEFSRLEHRVLSRIDHFFELNDTDRHAFRRTVRMLRYLREFAMPPNRHKSDPLLQSLLHPQAAMGEYQNRVLASQILRASKTASAHASLHRILTREQAQWQRKIKASLQTLANHYNSR